MRRLQACKYELMPTGEQQRDMRRFAGSCRFVFNKALALPKERYERGEKKKGHSERFRYPDPKQIKLDQGNSRVFLPKLGWLRYRNSREVRGTVKNITVSLSCGQWFVSIQTEREVEPPIPHGSAVGVDMGVARFATLSDGTFYAPLNSFRRHETALRKAQQSMSRKTRFTNNWKKAKARVQNIHSRIGNARRDYLHKATTTISQNHAMVCIEDLQVRNMSRSAAGTAEQPGRQVRAKSGLNKSILDQRWFEFRRQLDYKLAWNGGWLVAVPPQYTSRTCPCCGHVSADNRQTQARFECVDCGHAENADGVGAITVLRAGHARFACEVSGRGRPCGGNAASSRNPPKRPRCGSMPRLSAVGISGLQAGEDVCARFTDRSTCRSINRVTDRSTCRSSCHQSAGSRQHV